MEYLVLNNGIQMPMVDFGTWASLKLGNSWLVLNSRCLQ